MHIVCFCRDVDPLRVLLLRLTFYAFLSLQLKCAYLVPAKVPLQRRRYSTGSRPQRRGGAPHAKRITRNARSPSVIKTITTSRGGRRGSVASPPMKTRRRSRRGAVTSPARRLIGATCWGCPRCRLPATPRCRHRVGHRRPRVTRMWARARDKQLALPERTSGRSALAWRPVGRAPPSRREPRPAKLTPPRRSEQRSAPVCQLYDGSDRPNSDSLQRRRSRGKSTDSARSPSAPRAVESGAAPWRM
jgi:hypothetical protein